MPQRDTSIRPFPIIVAGVAAVTVLAVLGAVLLRDSRIASANPLTGVTAVAAGETNSCYLLSGGSVKCAGQGSSSVPSPVSGLTVPVAAIAAGSFDMCALTTAGGVKCWSGTVATELPGFTSGISAISLNSTYGCAVRSTGAVSCWGYGSQGLLGDGVLTSGVASVAAGFDHACGLMSSGTVQCWGKNDTGQLGNGSTADSSMPVDVQGISGASAVTVGINHSCALVSGGVQCWGQHYGTSPAAVPGLSSGVASLSASHLHTCAVLSSGALKCWGSNVFGQLGDGLGCGGQCASPTTPTGLGSGVSQVAAGSFHTCAVLATGAAKCWGINGLGNLGIGTTINSTTPREVVSAASKPPPTPTPCPAGGCPTATPTSAGPPLTGVDWSIAIDVDSDGVDDCSTKGTDFDSCIVSEGSVFTLKVALDALSQDSPDYHGFDIYMEYGSVVAQANSFVTWPECDDPPTAYGSGWLAFGCNIFAGIYKSNYTGQIGGTGFTCADSGSISLHHGSGDTGLYHAATGYHRESGSGSETLSITCVDPAADFDNDGCTNGQELSANPASGGQRDPYNPWDYFDPTGNELIRIDDVLMVVDQYFADAPAPGYTAETDRTKLGAIASHLGPPDGQQRVEDILAVLGQYYHDCA